MLSLESTVIPYKMFTKFAVKYNLDTYPVEGELSVRRIFKGKQHIGFIEYIGGDLYEVWFTDAFKKSL